MLAPFCSCRPQSIERFVLVVVVLVTVRNCAVVSGMFVVCLMWPQSAVDKKITISGSETTSM